MRGAPEPSARGLSAPVQTPSGSPGTPSPAAPKNTTSSPALPRSSGRRTVSWSMLIVPVMRQRREAPQLILEEARVVLIVGGGEVAHEPDEQAFLGGAGAQQSRLLLGDAQTAHAGVELDVDAGPEAPRRGQE